MTTDVSTDFPTDFPTDANSSTVPTDATDATGDNRRLLGNPLFIQFYDSQQFGQVEESLCEEIAACLDPLGNDHRPVGVSTQARPSFRLWANRISKSAIGGGLSRLDMFRGLFLGVDNWLTLSEVTGRSEEWLQKVFVLEIYAYAKCRQVYTLPEISAIREKNEL